MRLSRRAFLLASGSVPFVPLIGAGCKHQALASRAKGDEALAAGQPGNLYMAFNDIRHVEEGESDQYTTIRNIQRLLAMHGVTAPRLVIGIGARSGTPDNVYGAPGEMGYLWRYNPDNWESTWSTPSSGFVTNPEDSSPTPLGLDDPIAVTQIAVLEDSDNPQQTLRMKLGPASETVVPKGTVLWTLFNDDTAKGVLATGFNNAFTDVADGAFIQLLYQASKLARGSDRDWKAQQDKQRGPLEKYLDDLKDDDVWRAFADSLGKPLMDTVMLAAVQSRGWQGAGVVMQGSVSNVTQFYLREWVRKKPSDPKVQIQSQKFTSGNEGHIYHTPFGDKHLKYGREIQQLVRKGEAAWAHVGFIYDIYTKPEEMKPWMEFGDLFGQHFHIHGFSDAELPAGGQAKRLGGHTIFAMMGAGEIQLSLYPLQFVQNQTAFRFANELVLANAAQSGTNVVATVRNEGENFMRNVRVTIRRDGAAPDETQTVNLDPGQELTVTLSGSLAAATGDPRLVEVDGGSNYSFYKTDAARKKGLKTLA